MEVMRWLIRLGWLVDSGDAGDLQDLGCSGAGGAFGVWNRDTAGDITCVVFRRRLHRDRAETAAGAEDC